MDIQDLFDLVIQEKASDLILSAGAPPILRVNGQLYRTRSDTLTPEMTEKMIFSFLTKEQKEQFKRHLHIN